MPGKCRTLGSRSAGICRTHFSEMKLISQLNRKHWSNFGWGFFLLPKIHYVLGFPNPTMLQHCLPPVFLPSKVSCILWLLWSLIRMNQTNEMLPPKSSENSWPMFAPCTPSFLPSLWSPVRSALSSVVKRHTDICSSSPANPLGAHWHAESANFHSH